MDLACFLLCAILHIIMTRVQSKADLKVAVVGERVTLECRRRTIGIEWKFHRLNSTTPTDIYIGGIVPNNLKAEYEVKNITQDLFYLVIKSATIQQAGKYLCKHPEESDSEKSTLKLYELLLIFTVHKCKTESSAESNGVNTMNITCTFNVVGNLPSIILPQQEVCGDPITCVKPRSKNLACTLPLDEIGIFNQTPAVIFDSDIPADQIVSCEIWCLTWNNTTSSLDATVHLKCVLKSTGGPMNTSAIIQVGLVIVVVTVSAAVFILSVVIAVIYCICCKRKAELQMQSNSKSNKRRNKIKVVASYSEAFNPGNEPFGRHENEAIQDSQYSEIFKPEVSYSYPHDHCISENSAYLDPQYDAIEDVLPRDILKKKKTGKQV